MQYLNQYKPPPPAASLPADCHLQTPPEEYDLNFCGGPVYPLSTDKVALIPFIPSLHAPQLFALVEGQDELYKYMPYVPRINESFQNLLTVVETAMRSVPGSVFYAIFDLTKITPDSSSQDIPGPCPIPEDHPPLSCMAGAIGLLNVDMNFLSGEIGHVLILPHAQRTHVHSHATALLMHYALDHPANLVFSPTLRTFTTPFPSAARPALGLRRVQWQAHHHNLPSAAAALRMGFTFEGLARYQRICWGGSEEGREGDGKGRSRTSWVGIVTWKEWVEGGVKEKVDAMVAR